MSKSTKKQYRNGLDAWDAIINFGLENAERLQKEYATLLDNLSNSFGIEVQRKIDSDYFNDIHDLITELETLTESLADEYRDALMTQEERYEQSVYNPWTD